MQTERRRPPPHRILFADDHQHTREVLGLLLTKAGYEVDAAVDGNAAFHRIQEKSRDYDLLITDHEMPGLDGLQLVEKLREARFPGSFANRLLTPLFTWIISFPSP